MSLRQEEDRSNFYTSGRNQDLTQRRGPLPDVIFENRMTFRPYNKAQIKKAQRVAAALKRLLPKYRGPSEQNYIKTS
ncbi:UNVERIFIED_CONTAM: hypothetical protein PYX00_000763 [Menopon gallinae]|uniref:Ribosomal protein S18 n=1 Tax=Menopon gallinae TaxID=328185 RepID=A0AAW2IAD4_9NEOP